MDFEKTLLDDFQICDKFAEGVYAVVVRAETRQTQTQYALKFFGYKQQSPKDDWILREADYLKSLKGLTGAVQLKTVFNDSKTGELTSSPKIHQKKYPVIALEKLNGGSLSQYLEMKLSCNENVPEKEAALIFRNTIVALREIHVHAKLVHCKLEPLNVFFAEMNDSFPTKIVDFGFSMALYYREEHYSYVRDVLSEFNPEFLAPETILEYERSGGRGAVFSRATDIWQTGCILFMILHQNRHPFGNRPDLIKAGHFSIDPSLSEPAQDLLLKILSVDPSERLTSYQILEHEWFKVNGIDPHAALVHEAAQPTIGDYEIGSKLGDGSYGWVMNARRKSDGAEVVMKFFGYTKPVPDTYWILREIHSLQGLVKTSGAAKIITTFNDSREGILTSMHGVAKRHDGIYPIIVMEKLAGGDLFTRISTKSFSEQDASKVFRNFIIALNEVHDSADVIVGDIKLDNIVLVDGSEDFPVKIIDFGMSYPLLSRQEHYDSRLQGTPAYRAPETLLSYAFSDPKEAVYSRATDIFQAGVVLYLMLHSQYPFGDEKDPLLARRIVACRYLCADTLSPEAKDLIHRIFVPDPTQRITGRDILSHPWIVNNASLPTDDLGPEYRSNIRNWVNFRAFKHFLVKNQKEIVRTHDVLYATIAHSPRSPAVPTTASFSPSTDSSDGLSPRLEDCVQISVDVVRSLRDRFCEKLGLCKKHSPVVVGSAVDSTAPDACSSAGVVEVGVATVEATVSDCTRNSQSDGKAAQRVCENLKFPRKSGGSSSSGSGRSSSDYTCDDSLLSFEDERARKRPRSQSISAELLSHRGINFQQFSDILSDVNLHYLANEEVFEIFDWNKDSSVDYKEFLFTLCSFFPHDTIEVTAQLYFTVFDVDGSGSISQDELADVMSRLLGVSAGDPAIQTLYNTIDMNKDGEISLEEFMTFHKMVLESSSASLGVHSLSTASLQ